MSLMTTPEALCFIITSHKEKSERWKTQLLLSTPSLKNIFDGRIICGSVEEIEGDESLKLLPQYNPKASVYLLDFEASAKSNILQAVKLSCTSQKDEIHIINEI